MHNFRSLEAHRLAKNMKLKFNYDFRFSCKCAFLWGDLDQDQ